jgi:osmotically-inducible protein OsmY
MRVVYQQAVDLPLPLAAAGRAWLAGRLVAALLPPAGLLLGVAVARPAAPPAPEAASRGTSDVELAIRAHQAILKDEALASVNIGVRVRDGVATVWGPVPSVEVARQILEKVHRVSGVREVRSELAIVPHDGNLPDDAAPAPSSRPQSSEPAAVSKLPLPAGALTGRQSGDEPAPAVTSVSLLPPTTALAPAADTSRPPPASLGRPVPLPPGSSTARPGAAPTQATAADRAASPDLSAALDALRRGDARFQGIQWQVRDRVVTLGCSASRGEDLMAFANAVSRVPGVERVILGQVHVDPLAAGR